MLAARTQLLWSLPVGLVLAIGILWARRKKQPDASDSDGKRTASSCDSTTSDDRSKTPARAPFTHSVSLPIAAACAPSTSPTDLKLGKSAPIAINNKHKTESTRKTAAAALPEEHFDDVDSHIDGSDDDDDPISALSDSGDRRRLHYSFTERIVNEGNPVVVKATNPAKISPEHSFVESKYTTATPNGNDETVAKKEAAAAAQKPTLLAKRTTFGADDETTVVVAKQNVEINNNTTNGPVHTSVGSPSSSLSSVRSKDSGKGSTPPSFDEPMITTYEFLVKQDAVGAILGRKGEFVREIKATCHADVVIKFHPKCETQRIVSVEGTQEQVDNALSALKNRLKPKHYPNYGVMMQVEKSNRSPFPLKPINVPISVSVATTSLLVGWFVCSFSFVFVTQCLLFSSNLNHTFPRAHSSTSSRASTTTSKSHPSSPAAFCSCSSPSIRPTPRWPSCIIA